MNTFEELESVVDCAVAADGGSIGLAVADRRGDVTWFSVDRSIQDRGTASWNAVHASEEQLDRAERARLAAVLQRIAGSDKPQSPCHGLLLEFLSYVSEEA